MRQLILPVQLRDDLTFDNFYPGSNAALIDYLKNTHEKYIFLMGPSGLTHVLQAMCHDKTHAFYLSFKDHADYSPEMLENISELELIALDDIDQIAGIKKWEEAIFHLFNQTKNRLVMSSHTFPDIKLPDLTSRLYAMLLLEVKPLSDEEKLCALQQRAEKRGFKLPDEVGRYLLNHAPRDMAYLFDCLQKLDTLSLSEKRRLTIPFVKKALNISA